MTSLMSINNQKKLIFKNNLKQNVCFVTLSSFNPNMDISDETKCGVLKEFPVTLYNRKNDVYSISGNIQIPEEDINNVAAWDIHQEKYILIDMDDLLEWSFQSTPVEEESPQDPTDLTDPPPKKATELYVHNFDKSADSSIELLKHHEKKIAECDRMVELGMVSREKLVDILYRRDCDDLSWNILKCTSFTCESIEQLRDADDDCMNSIRDGYMNYIRIQRESAFKELDQLEDEVRNSDGSESDLQDIDTIKQMFRDIPQDIDLSQYKDVEQLFGFWPSLLLPTPIDTLYTTKMCSKASTMEHSECSPDIQRMCKCVDSLEADNIDELFELIVQAESQQKTKEQFEQDIKDEATNKSTILPSSLILSHAESMYHDQMYLIDLMRDKLKELQG
jgi:hypothetical protein